MEKYNKIINFFKITVVSICACFFITFHLLASNSAEISFKAKISDGSCDIGLSDSSLSYGIHRASDMKPASAVMILPLYINILCNGNTRPALSVSGSTYKSQQVAEEVFFRDADSVASGVGFMVRKGENGINSSNFYNTDVAFKNQEPIQLSAVLEQEQYHDYLLLGLVRAESDQVTPGIIKATLILRADYE